jgi:Domain of unknown function (DUF1990)
MLFLSIPGENAVQSQESSRFSYSGVGESKGGAGPAGHAIDHSRVQLSLGIETFERAKIAIGQRKMFAMPWVQLCWSMRRSEYAQMSQFCFRISGLGRSTPRGLSISSTILAHAKDTDSHSARYWNTASGAKKDSRLNFTLMTELFGMTCSHSLAPV